MTIGNKNFFLGRYFIIHILFRPNQLYVIKQFG